MDEVILARRATTLVDFSLAVKQNLTRVTTPFRSLHILPAKRSWRKKSKGGERTRALASQGNLLRGGAGADIYCRS